MSSQTQRRNHKVYFFKVIVESALRDGELMIPRSFVKRYGKELSSPVTLMLPNSPKWKVSLIKRDHDILFQKGSRRRGSFRGRNCSRSEAIERKNEAVLKAAKERALERARDFHSENPFFIRPLCASYIQNTVVIPTGFSREYLDGYNGNVSIAVDEDMPLSVKFKFNANNNRSFMTTGWTQFSQKYNLQEGDVCVFEMIDCTKFMFKVIIYRAREQPNSDQLQG
ncbi:DNA-binding barrel domain superfamily [Sesbania bispinosa]|nr:DNA-binding barrel domain superfamily [Sesbania bispinosa]